MRTSGRSRLLLVGALVAGFTPAAAAAPLYSFARIEVPTASATYAYDINNGGLVVGRYSKGDSTLGFLFDGTNYVTIMRDGATLTAITGINDAGTMVGNYYDAAGLLHGFVSADGVDFLTLDFPGARPNTTGIQGINNRGEIVGLYYDSVGAARGFIYDRGEYTPFDVPNAAWTLVIGINDAGALVGAFKDTNAGNAYHGFIFDSGSYSVIDFPDAPATLVFGVNNHGDVVGAYDVGHVRAAFASLDTPPFGLVTAPSYAMGINDSREIVGWVGAGGQAVSYLATPCTDPPCEPPPVVEPVPEPSTMALFAVACGYVLLTARRNHSKAGLKARLYR